MNLIVFIGEEGLFKADLAIAVALKVLAIVIASA
jgi:hypothetical protein